MMPEENISAIATPPGKGGVAIIRLSGGSPLSIAEKMFVPAGTVAVKDFEPYRLYPGRIDGGTFTDYGLCCGEGTCKSGNPWGQNPAGI